MNFNVLLVENNKLDQLAFTRQVEKLGLPYTYLMTETVQEARILIQENTFDVVLVDYELNDGTGLDLLDSVPRNVAIIFITGAGSEEIAIKALRAGASDYLVKDKDRIYLLFLPLTIERAVQQKRTDRHLWTLSQAVMSSSDCIYVTDLNDNITHVNRAFCETYGYESDELIGQPCRTLLARGSVPTLYGATGELESFHQRKDGSRFPVSMSRTDVMDSLGMPFAHVIIVRDYTERRQAQQRLRESEERYRSLVAALAEGVILQDREGNIQTFNDSAERILGLKLDQLKNRQPGQLDVQVFSEDGTLMKASEFPSQITLNTGEAQHQVIMGIQQEQDDLTWIAMNTEPLWRKGETAPIAVVSSFSDITQLKKTIAERDQLIEHLDSFAHSVAHDLKNPLGLVLGYASLLADEVEVVSSKHIFQTVHQIENAARTMSRIIDALLLLAGTQGMEDVPQDILDIPAMVQDVEKRLKQLLDQYGAVINVTTNLPPSLGYAPWVEEIFINYVSNALKYGGKPPQIEIGAENMADGMVRYWVRDNGKGLSAAEQQQLFRPFKRLEQTSIDGYGLGLSIVRQITKRLGGSVHVTSQLNEGSEFSFCLPAVPLEIQSSIPSDFEWRFEQPF